MPSGFTVVLDACTFYSATLRDFLLSLAMTDMFRARWTEDIHREWMRALLAKRPDIDRAKLERTRALMDSHVLDCLVTGYQPLIEGLVLPDMKDRHVLAAAIRAGADVIVTYNTKHFPTSVLKTFGMHAEHPDEFIVHLIDLDCGAVCRAAKEHRARLKNPPKTIEEYLEGLQKQELPRTVAALEKYRDLL